MVLELVLTLVIAMANVRLSQIFSLNTLILSIFGAWPTVKFPKIHKIFCLVFTVLVIFLYFIILTVNLINTRSVDTIIREGIIYVTQLVGITKLVMIFVKRDDILEAVSLLNSESFMNDNVCRKKMQNTILIYKKCHMFYMVCCNIVFSTQGVLPLILHGILKTSIVLPFSEFSFLSEEVREKYFVFWYSYQSLAVYANMMYEVNIDAIMFGLIFITISHLQVINNNLMNLKMKKHMSEGDIPKLVKILIHYDNLLTYCESVQKILSVTMFIQFCTSAALICVIMCGLLLPSSTESRIFMVTYFVVMVTQIFMPGWLGTQIEFESQQLVFAAYNVDWIPRSERFKSSLRLFVERANTPIVLTGMKMFPLSLETFTMIMKMAYSLFTVVRKAQE